MHLSETRRNRQVPDVFCGAFVPDGTAFPVHARAEIAVVGRAKPGKTEQVTRE